MSRGLLSTFATASAHLRASFTRSPKRQTSLKYTAAQQALRANRWNRGDRGKGGKSVTFCFFCFGSPEAFQRGPGGRGYVLTRYGLKSTHLDLVHSRFHICHIFSCDFLCHSHLFCAKDTQPVLEAYQAVLEPYVSVIDTRAVLAP